MPVDIFACLPDGPGDEGKGDPKRKNGGSPSEPEDEDMLTCLTVELNGTAGRLRGQASMLIPLSKARIAKTSDTFIIDFERLLRFDPERDLKCQSETQVVNLGRCCFEVEKVKEGCPSKNSKSTSSNNFEDCPVLH
jgi:hypothetical protein